MSPKTRFSIFLSSGTPYKPEQVAFVEAVRSHLRGRGCEPKTVGQNAFSVRQPAELARDLIGECDGAVVIAFERMRIVHALDRPDSPDEKDLHHEAHPTVWNQMEAALAYGQRVPIFTLVQRGLRRQAMLSDRLEWQAIEADLTPQMLTAPQFQQAFEDWLGRVETKKKDGHVSEIDLGTIGVVRLVSLLNVKQAASLLAFTGGAAALLCAGAFKLGQLFSAVAPHG